MITFMWDRRFRRFRAGLGLLGLLSLAQCAAPGAPRTGGAAPVAPGGAAFTYGIVAAVRPVPAKENPGKDILGAIGTALVGGVDASAGRRAECIVRTEDDRTLSIIQRDPAGCTVGERVAIPTGQARIVPVGS